MIFPIILLSLSYLPAHRDLSHFFHKASHQLISHTNEVPVCTLTVQLHILLQFFPIHCGTYETDFVGKRFYISSFEHDVALHICFVLCHTAHRLLSEASSFIEFVLLRIHLQSICFSSTDCLIYCLYLSGNYVANFRIKTSFLSSVCFILKLI